MRCIVNIMFPLVHNLLSNLVTYFSRSQENSLVPCEKFPRRNELFKETRFGSILSLNEKAM